MYNKSPQIVGLRPPVCSQFFFSWHFTTPFNPKCCSIWYHLAVIYREVLRSQILRVRVLLAGWDLHQSNPPATSQYLSIQGFALYAAVWPQFQYQVLTLPQFDIHSPIWVVRVDLGGRNRCQLKSRPHIPTRLLCTL